MVIPNAQGIMTILVEGGSKIYRTRFPLLYWYIKILFKEMVTKQQIMKEWLKNLDVKWQ